MNQGQGSYYLLIQKLDEFIRKYYLNKVIRGIIFSASCVLSLFLISALGEYFFYFSPVARTVIFYFFIAALLISIVFWIIVPLTKYYKLGGIISYEQASHIIGQHFSEVSDRLLNILQLKQMGDTDPAEQLLIEASISQKIGAFKGVPFVKAINLKLNNKYVIRYLAPAIVVLLILVLASPRVLTEGTERLLNHNTVFEKIAPFKFNVLNKSLLAIQNDDYPLQVSVTGDILPNEAFITINDVPYKLSKKSKNIFEYKVSNVQKDLPFTLNANGFNSKEYLIKVIPKPIIVKFDIDPKYPSYTHRSNEIISNTGDITVPQGTILNWIFSTKNTNTINVISPDQPITASRHSGDEYAVSKKLMGDWPYKILVQNKEYNITDSVSYHVVVIPDQYPSIQVNAVTDSTNFKNQFFAGLVSDDYGLKRLEFKYKISHADEKLNNDSSQRVKNIAVNQGREDKFNYFWNMGELGLLPGDKVDYYFEIWDNDEVNGSKSSRSSLLSYNVPSMEEIDKQTDKQNDEMKKNLEESLKNIKDLNKGIKKSQDDLLQKKNMTWEDKKKMQDLLDNQKEMMKKIEDLQKDYKNNTEQQNEYKQLSPELLEKQKQLQELSQQLLSPEMKELMQKLQELLDKLNNKDQTLQQLKNNEQQNEQLEKEMDRMLSLFKQLEFEQKFTKLTEKLDDLSKKQDEVNQQTEQKNPDNTQNAKNQDDINKKFEDLKKELEDLKNLNKELEQPMTLPDLKEKEQSVEQNLNKSSNELQKNNNSKAGQSQKSASKGMKEMSQAMSDFMQSSQEQQQEMDMNAVRQIIKNLVSVSFKEEDLINKTKNANIYNPNYLQIIKDQNRLSDDINMVKDSIQVLSKRMFEIKSYVDEQLYKIDNNQDKAVKGLVDRQTNMASSNQQFIMTSANNLALIFDEQLQQMQQQSQNSKPGSGTCNKPGGKGSKPSMSNMKSMQKQLNDKISKLQGQMKDGQKPGPGKQQGGQNGMSKEFAEMAAQQAAIRNALKQMNDQNSKDGKKPIQGMNELQQMMDKTEKELANKTITDATLKRQNDIMSRLLESEKAERQQDEDEKRKSNTANDLAPAIPPSLQEYLKKKQSEMELYKTLPPQLKPFYKSLVEDYFNKISQ